MHPHPNAAKMKDMVIVMAFHDLIYFITFNVIRFVIFMQETFSE